MSTNQFVRDLDLGEFFGLDGRRLVVVADGLPLWRGAQVAIDTTWVSPLHPGGSARRGAADRNGVALDAARRKSEPTWSCLVTEVEQDFGCWLPRWGAMVERNGSLLECSGRGTVAVSPTHPAREGKGRLASSLERHVGLQRSAVVRGVTARQAPCARCGR